MVKVAIEKSCINVSDIWSCSWVMLCFRIDKTKQHYLILNLYEVEMARKMAAHEQRCQLQIFMQTFLIYASTMNVDQ